MRIGSESVEWEIAFEISGFWVRFSIFNLLEIVNQLVVFYSVV